MPATKALHKLKDDLAEEKDLPKPPEKTMALSDLPDQWEAEIRKPLA